MLSVLIPIYNYNIVALVNDIHNQLSRANISYEIICLDDCSTQPFIENFTINDLPNSSFVVLGNNIGRSAIRNLLANKANYENLLFLDADTKIIKNDFIEIYLKTITSETQIIYGGIIYQKEQPSKDQSLRWVYGNKREALDVAERNKDTHLRFLTLNFVIKKNLFMKIRFNEEIPNLRHEDTLFALDAKKEGVNILHIDNPIMHLGLESSEVFLKKSIEACESLKMFVEKKLIEADDVSLSRTAKKIESLKLKFPVVLFYRVFENLMQSNLLSKNPSLLIFDMYRLGYYLQLKKEL